MSSVDLYEATLVYRVKDIQSYLVRPCLGRTKGTNSRKPNGNPRALRKWVAGRKGRGAGALHSSGAGREWVLAKMQELHHGSVGHRVDN